MTISSFPSISSPRFSTLLRIVLCFCSAISSFAQTRIDAFGIGKKRDFFQSSAAGPVSQAILGDPDGPYHFSADLSGASLNLLNPSPNVRAPDSNQYALVGDAADVGVARNFSTKAALDAAFANGTYTFKAGSYSLPITFSQEDGYPIDIPQVFAGPWTPEGRLLYDAAKPITLTVSVFGQYGIGNGALKSMNIYALSGNTVGDEVYRLESIQRRGDSELQTYTIAPGVLQPDQVYYAELSFVRIDQVNTDFVASTGAVGVASWVNTTGFLISTQIPHVLPAFTQQPGSQTVFEAQTASFTAAATGYPVPTLQWQRLPVGSTTWSNLTNTGGYSGTTTGTLQLGTIVRGMNGDQFRCVAVNADGATNSQSAILTVNAAVLPEISGLPATVSLDYGDSMYVSANVTGTAPLTRQWKKNGVALPGANALGYSKSKVTPLDSGSYTLTVTNAAGSVTSNVCVVTVAPAIPPYIIGLPTSVSLRHGETLEFSPSVGGTWPITFQWRKDGVVLDGATTYLFGKGPVSASDSGIYTLTAINPAGDVTVGTVTVTVGAAIAPAITLQPASVADIVGSSVAFSVAADGAWPIYYQWRKNGVAISGATSTDLTLTDLTYGDAGNYDVVITNSLGSATSAIAALTVNPAPIVTVTSSVRQVLAPGQSLSLAATASGTGALSYQWFQNGRPIAGANASAFSRPATTVRDSGWYVLDVTDSFGTTRSAPLFVIVAPTQVQVRGWGTGYSGEANYFPQVTDLVALSAGSSHTLALKRDGTVLAKGGNFPGLLSVPAGLADVVAIAAEGSVSLALKSDGTVVGWGRTDVEITPVPAGLRGVVAVATQGSVSLALKSNGTVVAWGPAYDTTWKVPSGLKQVIAIGAGYASPYAALQRDGTVQRWAGGVLMQPIAAIAALDPKANLALKVDGSVVAWGDNDEGQSTPPAGLSDVVAVAGMPRHALALKNDGTVVGWGDNGYAQASPPPELDKVFAIATTLNFSFALRDATNDQRPTIATPPSSRSALETAATTFSVVARGPGPFTYQWRKNGVSLAGMTAATLTLSALLPTDAGNYDVVVTNYVGSTTSSAAALTITPLPTVTVTNPVRQVLAPGQSLNLAVTATGQGSLSYQWLHNGFLVTGATSSTLAIPQLVPSDSGWYIVMVTDSNGTRYSAGSFVTVVPAVTQVTGWPVELAGQSPAPAVLNDAVAVAAGAGTSYALKRDGSVVGWSASSAGSFYGQLPIPAGVDEVVAIAAGDYHVVALKSNGTVVAWGRNYEGQTTVPGGLTDVVAVAAGEYFSLALRSNGTVVAWGIGEWTSEISVPNGLADVAAIGAGGTRAWAVNRDGQVVGWQAIGYPVVNDLSSLTDVTAVAGGYFHALALTRDGTVHGWGLDSWGQVTIPTGLTGVVAIAAGHDHSVALKSDGRVACWGTTQSHISIPPPGLDHVIGIAAGGAHTLALRDAALDRVPTIVTQPQAQVAAYGTAATFAVTAIGPPAPTYQWQKDGVDLYGATSASYTIQTVSAANLGSYRVIVTNAYGTVTSAAVALSGVPFVAASAASADFDRDGQADLIWQNTTTGERSFWLMNHWQLKQGVSLGTFAPDWSIAGRGDFNRDGQADLLWENTITGEVSVWLMNGTVLNSGISLGLYSTSLTIPGTGDFNGDGHTDIIWQNAATGERRVQFMTDTTAGAQVNVGNLPAEWAITGAGDMNGDGKPDLIWQNTLTGEVVITLMTGTSVSSTVSLGMLTKQDQVVATGDYTGDGKTDLVWTNISTGARTIWMMNGTLRTGTIALGTVSPDWSLGRPIFLVSRTARSDFDADGKTDLIWQNTATGERSVTLMTGGAVSSTVSLGTVSIDWVISAAGDFNHDEKPDLVWTNTVTGERSIWLMDGATHSSTVSLGNIPTYWLISAVGDFNYDGKADIVWNNTQTGERSLWLMNDTVFSNGIVLGLIPAEWVIAVAADLNGDGKTDIVWQNNTTGERSVWLLNGGHFSAGVDLGVTPAQWQFVGSGDFNADGKADLVLQNITTGERVVWLMNGTTHESTISIGTYATDWSIRN